MKKVLLTLFLSLIFLISSKANGNDRAISDFPKITITVEIGIPPTCFIAWQICRITVGVGTLAATAESFPVGDGSGGGGGRSWIMNIPRENFVKYYPDYAQKLDGKNSVTFEKSYALPDDVKKALQLSGDVVIKGNVAYPLKYENGEFTITFPL